MSKNVVEPEAFLVLRRVQRDSLINVKSLNVKYPLFCCILMKLEFYRQIF